MSTPGCSKNYQETSQVKNYNLRDDATINKALHSNVHDEDKAEPNCSKNHSENDTPNEFSLHNVSEEETSIFHSNVHCEDNKIQICSTSPQTSLEKVEEPPRRTGDKTSPLEPPEPEPPPEPSLQTISMVNNLQKFFSLIKPYFSA